MWISASLCEWKRMKISVFCAIERPHFLHNQFIKRAARAVNLIERKTFHSWWWRSLCDEARRAMDEIEFMCTLILFATHHTLCDAPSLLCVLNPAFALVLVDVCCCVWYIFTRWIIRVKNGWRLHFVARNLLETSLTALDLEILLFFNFFYSLSPDFYFFFVYLELASLFDTKLRFPLQILVEIDAQHCTWLSYTKWTLKLSNSNALE